MNVNCFVQSFPYRCSLTSQRISIGSSPCRWYVRSSLSCGSESKCNDTIGAVLGTPKVRGSNAAVWERMAVAVKYTEKDTSMTYLDTIRATHDPSLHLKTIEDELKGTIGKALGRQGWKIVFAIQQMEKELQVYNDLLAANSSNTNANFQEEIMKSAQKYNEYRKQALQARWELTVQRQAAGFIVNNHNFVTEQYPIKAALNMSDENDKENVSGERKSTQMPLPSSENESKVKFTDQLQWWERVGRWR
jgi:hypothetical protein